VGGCTIEPGMDGVGGEVGVAGQVADDVGGERAGDGTLLDFFHRGNVGEDGLVHVDEECHQLGSHGIDKASVVLGVCPLLLEGPKYLSASE